MKAIEITILAVGLALSPVVRADGLININFSDGGSNVGHSQINVVNGYAVSGYFDVTAGLAAGNYTLYTAGGTGVFNSLITSPSGRFIYDNAVYLPPATNPQYPVGNPILDNGGLLFTDASNNEVNLWGNADGSYTFDAYFNNAYLDNTGIVGTSNITPTPEPSSLALMAMMLVPAGFFFRRLPSP